VQDDVSAQFVVVLEAHGTEGAGEELAAGVFAEVAGVAGLGFEALRAKSALNNGGLHYKARLEGG
jgi:hypothetical protein